MRISDWSSDVCSSDLSRRRERRSPDPMQQQISVITLGVADLAVSRHFYTQGFGWQPVFENDEILFYQMNGFVFGTWRKAALAQDMARPSASGGAALDWKSTRLNSSH